MTIKIRRLIVVVPAASILLLANFLALGEWLESIGVIGWARSISAEYITGTTIAVIAALLILIPAKAPGGAPADRVFPEGMRSRDFVARRGESLVDRACRQWAV